MTRCGCDGEITSEAQAQRHAKECSLMGYPANATTCRVTVYTPSDGRGRHMHESRPCGEPTVAGAAICARHLADQRRLA